MTQSATNRPQAVNFARSAIAPLIRAGVMMANISWKAEKAVTGIVPARSFRPMPCIPRKSRFPIRPAPASGPKLSEYP